MGLKRVMWVRRYQGQCRALRPLGHQGYRLRSYNKDQPLCSGYSELPDMNAEEMAKEGFYLVKSVLRHRYRQGWRFLTPWEGFGVEEATWEPFSAFVLPEGRLNSVLVDYLSQNNLGELLRLAETLASKTKARD